jgi:hypothetical protein
MTPNNALSTPNCKVALNKLQISPKRLVAAITRNMVNKQIHNTDAQEYQPGDIVSMVMVRLSTRE